MAEATESQADSPESKADAVALIEEAEAEAAEAEALAAAAAARARAARLRRQALAATEAAVAAEAAETGEIDETEDENGETEGDEDDEYQSDEYEDKPRRRWLRTPSLSTIAYAAGTLLICGFVALSGLMVWHHRDSTQRQQRVAKFVAGAKQGIINMTSMDFNRAKEDVQRMLDSSTGQFKDDFAQRAPDFTKVVEQSKVATEGTVTAAAVESMDAHSARVLVAATSHITNNTGAKDEPRAWRFRVTVTEEDGQYKMSKVEFVP
jgi:Mce-associated membrane protein